MKLTFFRRITKYRVLATILFYIFLGTRFYLKYAINSPDEYGILSALVVVILFCCWFIILLDMILHKIKNKIFWIVIMFLLAYFTPVFYVFQRKTVSKYKVEDYYQNIRRKASQWKK